MNPQVRHFHHAPTNSFAYVVFDRNRGDAVIIDPVLDFDARSCRTSTAFADTLMEFVRERSLTVHWILETHVHADHVSAANYLALNLGCGVAIGNRVTTTLALFDSLFDFGQQLQGRPPFDWLMKDGDEFAFGSLQGRVVFTPGHTTESVAYIIGDAVFVGDVMFMPDCGTGRCDFPGGDACALYASIEKLLTLVDSSRIFLCHDYPPEGREALCESSVADQKRANVHLVAHPDRKAFVLFRTTRDKTLPLPALLFQAVQLNLRAGALPAPAANGRRYLKMPLNARFDDARNGSPT